MRAPNKPPKSRVSQSAKDSGQAVGSKYAIGRPRSLKPDQTTIAVVYNLGRCRLSHGQAAVILGVTRNTFRSFLTNYCMGMAAWREGHAMGSAGVSLGEKMSLARVRSLASGHGRRASTTASNSAS